MKVIEVEGTVDGQRHLDEPLPVDGPERVRVIILIPEAPAAEEREWLRAATNNPAFDFLKDAEEDSYTSADRRPFVDRG